MAQVREFYTFDSKDVVIDDFLEATADLYHINVICGDFTEEEVPFVKFYEKMKEKGIQNLNLSKDHYFIILDNFYTDIRGMQSR